LESFLEAAPANTGTSRESKKASTIFEFFIKYLINTLLIRSDVELIQTIIKTCSQRKTVPKKGFRATLVQIFFGSGFRFRKFYHKSHQLATRPNI
jgi:hypothetical protein